jgi:hypothetical protein
MTQFYFIFFNTTYALNDFYHRLLDGKVRSVEYEKMVVSQVKAEYGVLLSSRIERMITEFIFNRETLMQNFREWAERTVGIDGNMQLLKKFIPQFTVGVYHESTWSSLLFQSHKMDHLFLPPKSTQGKLLSDSKDAFARFYAQKYSSASSSTDIANNEANDPQTTIPTRFQSSRKLSWNSCMGETVLKVFPNAIDTTELKRERAGLELHMLPIQALVLLCFSVDLFNTSIVSFQQICTTLGGHWQVPIIKTNNPTEPHDESEIEESEEAAESMDMLLLQRILHSLCYTKYPVLKKSIPSKDKKISFHDSFLLNLDFFQPFFPSFNSASKVKSISLPKPILEESRSAAQRYYEEEESGTISSLINTKRKAKMQHQIDAERAIVIEAQIVRLMKSRQSIDHADLVVEVIQNITTFSVDPKVVKKRIESLIDREYLRRDEGNVNLYHYIA